MYLYTLWYRYAYVALSCCIVLWWDLFEEYKFVLFVFSLCCCSSPDHPGACWVCSTEPSIDLSTQPIHLFNTSNSYCQITTKEILNNVSEYSVLKIHHLQEKLRIFWNMNDNLNVCAASCVIAIRITHLWKIWWLKSVIGALVVKISQVLSRVFLWLKGWKFGKW